MTTVTMRGFTVIELMLFLGITGMLFAALMVGVNSNITQQRYKESVVGLSSALQNQYSEVINTRNERGKDWTCDVDAEQKVISVNSRQPEGEARGRAAPCVLLGRLIEITDSGKVLKTAAVVGSDLGGADARGDLDTLTNFMPTKTTFSAEDIDIDWGSYLANQENSAITASILIVRSPASGLIRVFVSSNELNGSLASIIAPQNAMTPLVMCIGNEDRGSYPAQSLTIDPRVAGPDGVSTQEANGVCA